MSELSFGGNWSRIKLEIVQKYLQAYTKIMSRRKFRFTYIDAFAGTGYQTFRKEENLYEPMFPELAADEAMNLEGSARIALQITPRFSQYVFIEKNEKRFSELQKIQVEYADVDIKLRNVDANDYLQRICSDGSWTKDKAVVFLDPFGMQVKWETIKAIASTRSIDLWYLFPAGIGVNRLLTTNGAIPDTWKNKLDEVLGERNWESIFYETVTENTLFGEEIRTKKVGSFSSITQYFVNRLNSIFPQVAHNPLPIPNSLNSPMYILCFASANKVAVKIAQDILKKY